MNNNMALEIIQDDNQSDTNMFRKVQKNYIDILFRGIDNKLHDILGISNSHLLIYRVSNLKICKNNRIAKQFIIGLIWANFDLIKDYSDGHEFEQINYNL